MAGWVNDVALPPVAAGSQRSLRFVRYGGAGARPKAYVQAALHADEAPGLLVAHHLRRQLDAAEARGEIAGQIVVAPYANPVGLAQWVNGEHLGRYDLAGGHNFNRGWPDLVPPVADRIAAHLGKDAAANAAMVRDAMRDAMRDAVRELPAVKEVPALRRALAFEACDSDLILDLHCDDDAVMHAFLPQQRWPEAADLAGALGCRAVLLHGETGATTFAESFATVWEKLADRFPDHPMAGDCLSATVELRGFADVDDALAEADAAAIMRVLASRGYLRAARSEAPTAPACDATPLDACDILRAPTAGVLSYRVGLGEHVVQGTPVADVVDPGGRTPDEARQTVQAGTTGPVISRRMKKLVAAGDVVAKIAGGVPLPYRRGGLLED